MLTAGRADEPAARPRPRPHPSATAEPAQPSTPRRTIEQKPAARGRRGRQLARIEAPAPGQVVAAAGNAVVTAAKFGRVLGRSGWRLARQLPGVNVVEAQAQRLRDVAAHEMTRLLDAPQTGPAASTPEEQRVMALVQDADLDPQPLRSAMRELLARSAGSDVDQGRDYLFGTIVSQLVPDEARILSTLASGKRFATVDVVAKQIGRSTTRPVLCNASTVGAAAAVSLPQNVSTYLTRLQGFGLLAFGQPESDLDSQFDALASDPGVTAARASIERRRRGSAKIVRKSVSLSDLGHEFWRACAPSRPALGPSGSASDTRATPHAKYRH